VQARSRRTLERLLDAAEDLLERGGLGAATVPAIAARCGLSVGVVYRRFPDKDALMRGVYERFFARSRESNRAALEPSRWKGVPTRDVVTRLVTGMVRGYRQHRGVLRALSLYGETHPDRSFRRRASQLTGEAFQAIERLLLTRRRETSHPNPERALRLFLLAVGSTLRTLVLSPEGDNPFSTDDRLAAELSRMCMRYLGIPGPASRGKRRASRRPRRPDGPAERFSASAASKRRRSAEC
jgi:AcrR family transcriptional regulator